MCGEGGGHFLSQRPGDDDAEPALLVIACAQVTLDGSGDCLGCLGDTQRTEKEVEHLLQLRTDQCPLVSETLARQPQGPVPEVGVDV